ncbi:MAG: hypothetical protein AB7G13_06715 [Lautropia sp.]
MTARPAFKRWLTRYLPAGIERSTFVLCASLLLLLLYAAWQPLPQLVWSVDSAFGRGLLTALCWLGWAIVLLSV